MVTWIVVCEPVGYLFEHLLSVLVGILSMKELQDRVVKEVDLQVLHTTSGSLESTF